jgi:hypothetical protein
MNPIHEISAAPHFPHALRKSRTPVTRPEAILSVLVYAGQGAKDVEVTERDGEIYIAITAAE